MHRAYLIGDTVKFLSNCPALHQLKRRIVIDFTSEYGEKEIGKPSQANNSTGLGCLNNVPSWKVVMDPYCYQPNASPTLQPNPSPTLQHNPIQSSLDSEIHKCDGTEERTQAMLEEVITKPKLSKRLLSHPPVWFIFDIVMEIIRVTGFASTLFTAEEMDITNIREKMFLEKIIKLVEVHLRTLVEAKPHEMAAVESVTDLNRDNIYKSLVQNDAATYPAAKTLVREDGRMISLAHVNTKEIFLYNGDLVVGLDPQKTNKFLQLLAVCAKVT